MKSAQRKRGRVIDKDFEPSDSDSQDTEPDQISHQAVLVRNGLTDVQAIEVAVSCRPDHEFVSIRTACPTKDRPSHVRIYKCVHKDSQVERHIRRNQKPSGPRRLPQRTYSCAYLVSRP